MSLTIPSGGSPGRDSEGGPVAPGGAVAWAATALAALGRAADLGQLEEMLLAVAIHPLGPAVEAAYLLRWDEHSDLFVVRWARRGAEACAPLALHLEYARLRAARRAASRRASLLPPIESAMLGPVAGEAWKMRRSASGPAPMSGAPWSGAHEIAAAPLHQGQRPCGLLVTEWAAGVTPEDRSRGFADLATFADLALEFHERGRDRDRRAEQAVAVQELARTVVTPRNLAEVLHAAVRLAARAVGAHGGAVWLCDAGGGLRLDVTHGAPAVRERTGRAMHAVAKAVVEGLRPRTAAPGTDELLLPAEVAVELAGVAVWPLVAYGRAVGAMGLYREQRAGEDGLLELERSDLEFLSAAADMLALAVDHAGRFGELRGAQQREREAQGQLRRRERLASLGELSAQASQEALHPVASIRAFASRAQRGLAAGDATREYLEVVLREADRLERILTEQRAHAEMEPPCRRLGSLNDVLQSALHDAGERLVRRRVRLLKNLAVDVPPLLLDARRIGLAIGNLLGFALDSVAVGGRIRVETRRLPGHVLFELGHDGEHAAGTALEQLFVPFAASRTGGPGVGLGVAQRIVQEHGGEIRVRAEGEWSTIVTFTLPIGGNQDRRRARIERRSAARQPAAAPPSRTAGA